MKNEIFRTDSLPKVSVIIPVYNTGKYLREALDSICNQTLRELEIILINDGSTDNSQSICEEYALKDNRIQWHTQPNQGQAVARNNGLLSATGKYIYFMDSDDILDTKALQQCYDTCEQYSLDAVVFDAETILDDNRILNAYRYCRKGIVTEDKVWEGLKLIDFELGNRIFFVVPWLFFTRHSFLRQYFSGFPPGVIHEDHVFAMQLMLNARRIKYISESFFKRRIRQGSTMTTVFSMRNIEGYTCVCTQINSWVQQHEEWRKTIGKYMMQTLNAVIWTGHKMTLTEKVETICRFRRLKLSKYITLRNWLVFWFKSK